MLMLLLLYKRMSYFGERGIVHSPKKRDKYTETVKIELVIANPNSC